MKKNLIVCIDSKYGFSKNNKIPWYIKQDSNFFLDTTKRGKKNSMIMGRNTWYSLPDKTRGFKDRINIIVSKKIDKESLNNFTNAETYIVENLDKAFELSDTLKVKNAFVCGGLGIYDEFINNHSMDNVYITQIDKDYNCDLKLPLINFNNFNKIMDKTFQIDDTNVNFKKYSKDNIKFNDGENNYLNLMEDVLKNGEFRKTRNANTWSTFGSMLEFDMNKGFPLMTTKKVSLYNIFHELMFFIQGKTNTNLLSNIEVNIWNQNTNRQFLDFKGLKDYKQGDMGPMYGFQWRHFNAKYKGFDENYENKGYDQLKFCIESIKNDPFSRRHILTSYNPLQSEEGCLYPCHGVYIQFYVNLDGSLSCMMCQRSSDLFLGLPYNIASYSLLLNMIVEVINNDKNYKGIKLKPGKLKIYIADAHIYEKHRDQVIRQVLREPEFFPQLVFNRKVNNIEDFKYEDINLMNYDPYSNIIAEMIA